ncbi:hypothetical protein J7K50_08185 [bacterium]|nr:hypothetical protein [bacterium]
MVRPIAMQVNLLKLDEITQHQKTVQAQAVQNDHDRARETERIKDSYISTITRTERAEQQGIVKEHEEEEKKGGGKAHGSIQNPKDDESGEGETDKKVRKPRINIVT